MVLLTLLSARFVAVLSTLISTTVIILVILGWLYALRCTHGLYLWYFDELPLSKPDEAKAKYITTPDNRTIEYFIWGSTRSDATVSVICHTVRTAPDNCLTNTSCILPKQ
jgi:hypothetical protein